MEMIDAVIASMTTRQEKVLRLQVRIIEEIKYLSLEDLEDVLNGLIIARTYKSAHVPEGKS
jgi:hypothetical protein